MVVPRPQFEPEEPDARARRLEPEPGARRGRIDPRGGRSAGRARSRGGWQRRGGDRQRRCDDAEGARLIALNMALNGTPREETARYLNENFSLSDANGLLDEVYASVEG